MKRKLTIHPEVPFSLYLRYLVNLIIEGYQYDRADVEQLTREYEAKRIPNSSEKQLVARTRAYLTQLFQRHILDWGTVCVFIKILKVKRIKLSLTLYTETKEATFTLITENPDEPEQLPRTTQPTAGDYK